MAIEIARRPQGVILENTARTATVSNSSGDALFTSVSHGMSDAVTTPVVYMVCAVDRYNGFWDVDVIDSNTFKIINQSTGEYVQYLSSVAAAVTGLSVSFYRYIYKHGWSCVHLPIAYEMNATVESTAEAIITNFESYAGGTQTKIYTNGGLTLAYTNSTSHFIISGSDIDGVYRVVLADVTFFIIDAPYDTASGLIGAGVKIYYNNYHVKVNVYGGLTSGHYWTDGKPYELLTTLKFTPDNSGNIKFSISEILKKQIPLVNNPLLENLPSNLNAFTGFYITYIECFDAYELEYDGITAVDPLTIVVHENTEVVDTFEGYAANAQLPFKNTHAGFLSDYVTINTSSGVYQPAKFLSTFETPTVFDGYYFDVSALINGTIDPVLNYMVMNVDYYDANNNYVTSTTLDFPDMSAGVYRFPFEANCTYKKAVLYITYNEDGPTYTVSERKEINIDCNCYNNGVYMTWLNPLGGFDYWLFTGQSGHQIDIKENNVANKNLFQTWPSSWGAFSTTVRQETSRKSCFRKTIRSQTLTLEQLQGIQYIKTSPLVQIVNSLYDIRTALVDTESFVVYTDGDKEYSIEFDIEYTDYAPSQKA